jgi:hypothetical protein
MALEISASLTTITGIVLTSTYGRLEIIASQNEINVVAKVHLYASESAFNNHAVPLKIKEFPTPVVASEILTPAQYNTLNMTNVHTKMRNLLENGWGNPGDEEYFAGLGPATVTVVMPS